MPRSNSATVTEAYEKLLNRSTELKNMPNYNPATNPAEYVNREVMKKRAERSLNHARAVLQEQKFELIQVLHAYGNAVGQERLDVAMKEIKVTSEEYKSRMWNYVLSRPDLAGQLSDEDKDRLLRHSDQRMPYIDRWKREGKITNEVDNLIKAEMLMGKSRYLTPEEELNFVNQLEIQMKEEQKEAFRQRLDSYVDVVDLDDEEKYDYPNRARARQLKENIPQEIAADPEKKAKYEHYLDYASEKVRTVKPAVTDARRQEEKEYQTVETRKSEAYAAKIPEYKNGKYHELFEDSNVIKEYQILKQGRENDLNDLYNEGIHLSDKTKEGMRLIINKMREMGLEKYPHDPRGEDDHKVYGFNKIEKIRKDFEEAIKNGNPDEIIEKGTAYENTIKEYEELYVLAKEYFSNDNTYFPGNMDSVRNGKLPYEFTSDLATTARINAMFMNYINVAENNLDLEAYLENPLKETVDDALKKFDEKSFEKLSKVNSLDDALDLLTGYGAYNRAKNDFVSAVPVYGLPRQLAAPSYFEQDEKLREPNYIYKEALGEEIKRLMYNGTRKFDYFAENPSNEIEKRNRIQTVKNLIIASGEPIDVNEMLYGLPKTDMNGRVIGEGFNAARYMQEHEVDYAGLMERSEQAFKRVRTISEERKVDMTLTTDNVLEAMNQLYLEVLTAHPEDKEKPAYLKMREEYLSLADRLSEKAPEELKERMKAEREAFIDANPIVAKPRVWHSPEYAYVAMIKKLPQASYTMLRDIDKQNEYVQKGLDFAGMGVEPNAAELRRYFNYKPSTASVKSINNGLEYNKKYSAEEQRGIDAYLSDLAKELTKIRDKEKEPYVKRMYDDYITYLKMDIVNFGTIYGENSDIAILFSLNMSTFPVDGVAFTVDEVKEKAGDIFYDHLDMTHYGMEEMRIESERLSTVRRLSKEGKTWGEKEEKEYTEKLIKNHNALISAFERLDANHEDGKKIENYIQNSLDHDLGRGDDEERDVRRTMGRYRGEIKALKMGWNSQDMVVLGMMGKLDAMIDKHLTYGHRRGTEGLSEAAKDFSKIKEKYWNKRIETNADKKEVADAVFNFIEKHKDCNAVKAARSDREAFDKAVINITKEAAKTQDADYKYQNDKMKNPVEYLKKYEEKGNIREFAAALTEIRGMYKLGRFGNGKLAEDIRKYTDGLLEFNEKEQPVKGWDFVKSLHKEMTFALMEQNITIAESSERLAREIRRGDSPYSKTLKGLGKDFEASNEIADAIIFSSAEATAREGAADMLSAISMYAYDKKMPDGKTFDTEKINKELVNEFLENRQDSYSKEKRTAYLNRGNKEHADKIGEYGISVDNKKNLTITDTAKFKDKTKTKVEGSKNDIVEYKSAYLVMVDDAKNQMTRLEELKSYKADNTKEFMSMYNAMKKVSNLSSDMNPDAITRSLEELEKAAKDYVKAKIEDSRFAGRHGNGALRVAFANDIQTFAKERRDALKEKTTGNIDIYDSIDRQIKSKAKIRDSVVREKMDIKELRSELEKDNPEKNKRRNSVGKVTKKTEPEKGKGKFNEI